jgi:protein-tyrosine phosphatase
VNSGLQGLLVVCTGNVCRSPMAEHMLRARLGAIGGGIAASAGISAWAGDPAEPEAVQVMQERGYDLSLHRARRFDLDLARGFDLILVMESAQQQWIQRRYPVLRGRVRRLGDALGLDVPDPLGCPVEAFRRAADVIERAVEAWALRLAS